MDCGSGDRRCDDLCGPRRRLFSPDRHRLRRRLPRPGGLPAANVPKVARLVGLEDGLLPSGRPDIGGLLSARRLRRLCGALWFVPHVALALLPDATMWFAVLRAPVRMRPLRLLDPPARGSLLIVPPAQTFSPRATDNEPPPRT